MREGTTEPTTPQRKRTSGSSSLRRVGRHTAVYTMSMLLTRAVSIVMLPLVTRYLTPADYGVIQLLEMTLEVIAIVAGSRLGAGVFVLYHKAKDEPARRAVLGSAFAVLAASFVLAGVVGWMGAPLIARVLLGDASYAGLVRIGAVSLGLQSLILIPQAEFQLRERSVMLAGSNLVKLAVQVGLTVLLLVRYDLGVRALMLATLAGNVVIGIPMTHRFIRHYGLTIDRKSVRGIFRLGLPFIGVQLAKFVMTFGDRYFLRAVRDTATVGVYALGYQFGFLLGQLGSGPFLTAWEPMRFEIAKRPDRVAVFNRMFLFLNLVLLTVAVCITLFVSDFLRIATTPPYYAAANVVPIILVAYVAQSWFGFHNYGLFAAERTEFITVANWVGAVVALAGYALLIPRWLGLGAAWATLLSFVASEWLVYVLAQRVHRVAYEWRPTIRLMLIATGVCAVGLSLPTLPLLTSIAAHAGLLGAYLLLVWVGGVLSPEERMRLRGIGLSPRAVVSALTR